MVYLCLDFTCKGLIVSGWTEFNGFSIKLDRDCMMLIDLRVYTSQILQCLYKHVPMLRDILKEENFFSDKAVRGSWKQKIETLKLKGSGFEVFCVLHGSFQKEQVLLVVFGCYLVLFIVITQKWFVQHEWIIVWKSISVVCVLATGLASVRHSHSHYQIKNSFMII